MSDTPAAFAAASASHEGGAIAGARSDGENAAAIPVSEVVDLLVSDDDEERQRLGRSDDEQQQKQQQQQQPQTEAGAFSEEQLTGTILTELRRPNSRAVPSASEMHKENQATLRAFEDGDFEGLTAQGVEAAREVLKTNRPSKQKSAPAKRVVAALTVKLIRVTANNKSGTATNERVDWFRDTARKALEAADRQKEKAVEDAEKKQALAIRVLRKAKSRIAQPLSPPKFTHDPTTGVINGLSYRTQWALPAGHVGSHRGEARRGEAWRGVARVRRAPTGLPPSPPRACAHWLAYRLVSNLNPRAAGNAPLGGSLVCKVETRLKRG